jgi:hypothetical protein
MVNNPTQDEVDRCIYGLEQREIEERQRREVREFWDRYRERRIAFDAEQRRLNIRAAAGFVGSILLLGAASYIFVFIRGIL